MSYRHGPLDQDPEQDPEELLPAAGRREDGEDGRGDGSREKIEPRNVRFSVRPDGVATDRQRSLLQTKLGSGYHECIIIGSDNDGKQDQ